MIMTIMSFAYASASAENFVDPTNENPCIEYVSDSTFKTIKVEIPSRVHIYKGDTFDIGIRTLDHELLNKIKYNINNNTLNIWIDNLLPDELYDLDSNNIRISIMVPEEVSVKTNSNLQLVNYNTNKRLTSHEND